MTEVDKALLRETARFFDQMAHELTDVQVMSAAESRRKRYKRLAKEMRELADRGTP